MSEAASSLEIIPTGIAGLDTILKGGFLAGGVYIVQGEPGSGKTILGNQLCYNHIAVNGGCALYVTLLAESHARMMAHISGLSFFDPKAVPDRVYYMSAFRVLEEDGLKGLVTLLRREVLNRKVSLVVLDGLVAAEETAGSPREFKKFIHELQTVAAVSGSSMFLLTSASAMNIPIAAEQTMVDGVVEMRHGLHGRRAERELIIQKRRGGHFLEGRHSFAITNDGLVVFPRTEAVLALPTTEARPTTYRAMTGIAGLDDMLGGGLVGPSAMMVVGPAGVGKTSLGLHFLSGCAKAEPGLLFSFYETPAAAQRQAAALGLALPKLMDAGLVECLWQPGTEGILDHAVTRLLENVRRRKVRRLFIDGLDGFAELAVEPVRIKALFTALVNELQSLGVATVYTHEDDLALTAGGHPLQGLELKGASGIAETIVLMRYMELGSELHRFVSVLKSRNSHIAHKLRRFEMTDRGIVVEPDHLGAEAVLTTLLRGVTPRGGE